MPNRLLDITIIDICICGPKQINFCHKNSPSPNYRLKDHTFYLVLYPKHLSQLERWLLKWQSMRQLIHEPYVAVCWQQTSLSLCLSMFWESQLGLRVHHRCQRGIRDSCSTNS